MKRRFIKDEEALTGEEIGKIMRRTDTTGRNIDERIAGHLERNTKSLRALLKKWQEWEENECTKANAK